MKNEEQDKLNAFYRDSFLANKGLPEAVHSSADGQTMRFRKLLEIADLSDQSILDLGCGQGDLYEHIAQQFQGFSYEGIEVVPEMVQYARERFPGVEFNCRNILSDPLVRSYDYVILCGLFNIHIPDCEAFMKKFLAAAFAGCEKGMGFNFISSHVTYTTPHTTYHNPASVLDFCIKNLSPKVSLFHHYGRADVAVFVYR